MRGRPTISLRRRLQPTLARINSLGAWFRKQTARPGGRYQKIGTLVETPESPPPYDAIFEMRLQETSKRCINCCELESGDDSVHEYWMSEYHEGR